MREEQWYFSVLNSVDDVREYLTQHPRMSLHVNSFVRVRPVTCTLLPY